MVVFSPVIRIAQVQTRSVYAGVAAVERSHAQRSLIPGQHNHRFARIYLSVAIPDSKQPFFNLISLHLDANTSAVSYLHILEPTRIGKQGHIKRDSPGTSSSILQKELESDDCPVRVLNQKLKRLLYSQGLTGSDTRYRGLRLGNRHSRIG